MEAEVYYDSEGREKTLLALLGSKIISPTQASFLLDYKSFDEELKQVIRSNTVSNRFSYVKYDDQAIKTQSSFKERFEALEMAVENHLPGGRAKSLVLTALEEAYMWVGKAIRDDQIARTGKVDE